MAVHGEACRGTARHARHDIRALARPGTADILGKEMDNERTMSLQKELAKWRGYLLERKRKQEQEKKLLREARKAGRKGEEKIRLQRLAGESWGVQEAREYIDLLNQQLRRC